MTVTDAVNAAKPGLWRLTISYPFIRGEPSTTCGIHRVFAGAVTAVRHARKPAVIHRAGERGKR